MADFINKAPFMENPWAEAFAEEAGPPDLGFKTRPENQYGRAPKRRVHQGGGCATWWNRVVLHKVLRCGCVRRRERGMAILVEGSKGRWQRG